MKKTISYLSLALLFALPSHASTEVEKKLITPLVNYANKFLSDGFSDDMSPLKLASAELISEVNSTSHSQVVPEYSEEGLKFSLRYDEKALANPRMLIADLAALAVIFNPGETFSSALPVTGEVSSAATESASAPHAIAEILLNSQGGSLAAELRWLEFKIAVLSNLKLTEVAAKDLGLHADTVASISRDLKTQIDVLRPKALKQQAQQKKAYETWKKETGNLEKLEAQELKLNDLVLRNDRRAVADVLRAYLPWSVMEPVEMNTWKVWLEAIEHPRKEGQILAFRGLDYETDKVQRLKTSQGEKVAFFSTILTKNQGNYTRRLRSINTRREINGDYIVGANGMFDFNKPAHDVPVVKISDAMKVHSGNPVGSVFLSFTNNPDVAAQFAMSERGGLLAVMMDRRRLIPNFSSAFFEEKEFLAPLIIFPDEVVAFKENDPNTNTLEEFKKEVFKRTGFSNTGDDFEAENKKYLRDGNIFLKEITRKNLPVACGQVF